MTDATKGIILTAAIEAARFALQVVRTIFADTPELETDRTEALIDDLADELASYGVQWARLRAALGDDG